MMSRGLNCRCSPVNRLADQGNDRRGLTFRILLNFSCRAFGEFLGIWTPELAIHTKRTSSPAASVIRLSSSALPFNQARSHSQFPENCGDFLCRRRMNFDPNRLFRSVHRHIAESVVPTRFVGVTGLSSQGGVEIDIPCQTLWIFTRYMPTVPVLQSLFPATIRAVHRWRRVLNSLPEGHDVSVGMRFATSATMSPTWPENSVRPPHPS